ncbi:amidase [Comamonadaceae bacterium OH2545_COT-014]|nr:amidase [Comamonadaceae bacterium OH2545_COT-014]
MSALHTLGLTAMLEALERGECTLADIWRSCRAQIAHAEPQVRAWQQLWEGKAPDEDAAQAGLLRGLPLGVKDTIDVRGLRAERGSAVWQGRMPGADAACISLLKRLGARVMGKTVTTEFAYFTPGATANPHRLTHTPGGSSSGSAAAVAAGMVPLALGSQTAASVIRPAAYCGVVGYVASVGSHALRGVMPLAHSLDALGLLARDVADLQYLVQGGLGGAVASGPPWRQPRAVLAIDGTAFGEVEPQMLALHEQAVAELARRGVQVTRDAGALLGEGGGPAWVEGHRQTMAYEAARTLAFEYDAHREALSPALRALIEEGMAIGDQRYAELCDAREAARARFAGHMRDHDAVLAPAAPGPAPEGLHATGRPDQSRPWQWLGAPQVTLPAAWNGDGLPLGLQWIGTHRGDQALLQVAHWAQNALGWRVRPPPTFAPLAPSHA